MMTCLVAAIALNGKAMTAPAIPRSMPQTAPGFIWIEGEAPTSSTIPVEKVGFGAKQLLSGQAWGQVNLDEARSAKELPDDGAVIRYEFENPVAGRRELWNRIAYEFVRSPFAWRIGNGTWNEVSPQQLTTDLQPIAEWTEIAWLKLGDVDLPAGKQTLEIRIPKQKNAKGEVQRTLYASDALVLTEGAFAPNGRFRPGEDWRTDADRAAAKYEFALPSFDSAKRSTLSLAGNWEIARDDEQAPPFDIAIPMELPKAPARPLEFWTAIPVPSDRNVSRPDLMFAHRIWYRTRVNIGSGAGRQSFLLKFGQNNLNTTVVVNGQLCGFEKNPWVPFQVDISRAVKNGSNEIMVGIRDAWYGYSTSPTDPMKLRKMFNVPLRYSSAGFQDLAYPIWNSFQSGILDAPVLESTAKRYASDVFVQPKWEGRRLIADVQVANPGPGVTVKAEVVDPKTGKVELTIPAVPATTEKVRLEAAFPNARIWWPDDPQMSLLRVRVTSPDGEDLSDTAFGFREWSHRGPQFLLNGNPWQGWAELISGKDRDEWLKNYRAKGQRFQRMSGISQNGGPRWNGMPFTEALRWTDENGVVIRRSGILDGQAIGYMAIENDPELRKLYNSEVKVQLLRNWKDQMVAQVKAERNHPSIHLWSLENEFLYINCINLYGNLMDEFEARMLEVGNAVAAADPTRLWMTDGGGAGKANRFPVAGDHYVYTNDPSAYPNLAYEDQPTGAGRGRWTWDKQRPRYAGEDFFATGINPADYAWIGGEEAFTGKLGANRGIALVQKMLTEGYRWNGSFGAFHLWLGSEGEEFGKYVSNAERAAFVREYDSTFTSTSTVTRTVGIFNDSRFNEPLELRYRLKFPQFTSPEFKKTFRVPPGGRQIAKIELVMPEVMARTEGEWQFSLYAGTTTVFRDVKPITVLPEEPATLGVKGLVVYSPVASPLATRLGCPRVSSLAQVPVGTRVLIVDENALTGTDSGDSRLSALAQSGVRVIVLAQNHPLRYQALPADLTFDSNLGEIAFWEDARHPVANGLKDRDLFAGIRYRNAYRKGTRGFKSIIQAGSRLGLSPLAEVPVGAGLLLICQIDTQDATKPVGERLITNLVRYADSYRQTYRPVTAILTSGTPFAKAIDAIGLEHQNSGDLVASLTKPAILVVEATPANLRQLVANRAKVTAFFAAGGTIVFNGLTPEGLADYNRIVGVNHQLRPFRRERTALTIPRHPLANGLSLGEISMLSSEKMFAWNDDMYIADDVFSYVVDTNDVAPFAKFPSDYHYNMTNGMVSADGWPYIFSMELGKGAPPEFEMTWESPQTLREMEWIGNGFYHLISKFELTGDDGKSVTFEVKPTNEAQTITFSLPITTRKLKFRAVDWTRDPNVGNVIGVDNIRLSPVREGAWKSVQPIANIGGLVNYPIGKGGVVLVNLAFKDREAVPANAAKKKAILAAILRNLNAKFAQSKLVIPGAAGNEYVAIDLSKQANQFRNEKGWFGDPNLSFRDFPAGRQVLASIPFQVYEFATSPVPNAVMLGGNGIPGNLPDAVRGIPVNQKASTLYFLHTARIDRRRNENEVREGRVFELAQYVIRYADGGVVKIPVRSELDIDDYRQRQPSALPGAFLAWTKPAGSTNLTAFAMPWTNPRPGVVIASIDLEYGKDRVGVPTLLAVSAVK